MNKKNEINLTSKKTPLKSTNMASKTIMAKKPNIVKSSRSDSSTDCIENSKLAIIDDLNAYKKYKRLCDQVTFLRNLPQPVQRSPEWFKLREGMITASDGGSALGENHYEKRYNVIFKKCGLDMPFTENAACFHGKKFETIATMYHEFKNNAYVMAFGLIPHQGENKAVNFIGASPDGICGYNTFDGKLNKIVGRMLEIKCPPNRMIKTEGAIDGDIIPHYYWVQVQLQLECCDLDECDFLQCKITEYRGRDEFMNDTNPLMKYLSAKTKYPKGCIIQLHEKDKPNDIFAAKWIYPPSIKMTAEECEVWAEKVKASCIEEHSEKGKYVFERIIYWKLDFALCTLVKRDREWFANNFKRFKQIWDYILYFRQHKKLIADVKKYFDDNNIDQENGMEIIEMVRNGDKEIINMITKHSLTNGGSDNLQKKYSKFPSKFNNNHGGNHGTPANNGPIVKTPAMIEARKKYKLEISGYMFTE